MYEHFYQKKTLIWRKTISAFVAVAFSASLVLVPAGRANAQYITNLPRPGEMVMQSPAFEPPVLKGMTLHPENPLRFDFIVDRGQDMLSGEALKTESTRLLKYFLAAMTIPDNDAWVNLSPYEGDRIIPDMLGTTDLGKQMLEQDYLLKQLSASLTNPQVELGKKFWDTVYKKAYDKFGTTAIPINTFNKVWITPDKAVILEQDGYVFIGESHLKVMLDEDYLALKENMKNEKSGLSQMTPKKAEDVSAVSADVVRQVIVPELEKEINTGKNFAPVRQMYHSVILATWYKQNLKKSLLGKIYVDKSKIKGVDISEKDLKQKIYDQYLAAFRKGVYNLIKEDYDLASKETLPRKYFSGGVVWASAATVITKDIPPFQRTQIKRAIDTLFNNNRFAQEGVLLTEGGSGEAGAIMAGLSAGGLGAGEQIVVPKYDADLSNLPVGQKVAADGLIKQYPDLKSTAYAVRVAGFYGFERETAGSNVLVKKTSPSAYFNHPAVREAAEILANGIMAYHGENLRTATSAYFAHFNSLNALLQESYRNAGEIFDAIKTAMQKVPLIHQALLDSFTSLQKHPEFSRADPLQTAFAYQFVGTQTVLLLNNPGVAAAGSASVLKAASGATIGMTTPLEKRFIDLAMKPGVDPRVAHIAKSFAESYNKMRGLILSRKLAEITGIPEEEIFREMDQDTYAHYASILELINNSVNNREIYPDLEFNVSDSDLKNPKKVKDIGRAPRVLYWAMKGDPWQTGHIWMLLESIQKFKIDKVIVGIDAGDPYRKRNLTTLSIREAVTKKIIEKYLNGFVQYTPIAREVPELGAADGEKMIFYLTSLNKDTPIDWYYGAGSDHANLYVLKSFIFRFDYFFHDIARIRDEAVRQVFISAGFLGYKVGGLEAYIKEQEQFQKLRQIFIDKGYLKPEGAIDYVNKEKFQKYGDVGHPEDLDDIKTELATLGINTAEARAAVYQFFFMPDTPMKIFENMTDNLYGYQDRRDRHKFYTIFNQRVNHQVSPELLGRYETELNARAQSLGLPSVGFLTIDQPMDAASEDIREKGHFWKVPSLMYELIEAYAFSRWGGGKGPQQIADIQSQDTAIRKLKDTIDSLMGLPYNPDPDFDQFENFTPQIESAFELIRQGFKQVYGDGLNEIHRYLEEKYSGSRTVERRMVLQNLMFERGEEIVINGGKSAAASAVNVLLVEDDPVEQLIAQHKLSNLGYIVTVVDRVSSAKKLLGTNDFNLIVADYLLPNNDINPVTQKPYTGDDLITWIAGNLSTTPLVLASNTPEARVSIAARVAADPSLSFVKILDDKVSQSNVEQLAAVGISQVSSSQVVSQPITLRATNTITLQKGSYEITPVITVGSFKIYTKLAPDGSQIWDKVLYRDHGAADYRIYKEVPAPGTILDIPILTMSIDDHGELTIFSKSLDTLRIEGITVTSASSSTALEGKNVVVVQNDLIARYLISKGANVSTFSSSEADKAMAQIRSTNPDLIISTNAEFLDRLSYTGRASQLLIVSKDTGIKDNTLSARLRNLGVSIRETEGNTASWISQNVFQQEILYNETGNTPVNLRLENMSKIKKDAEFFVKALGREYKLTISPTQMRKVFYEDTEAGESVNQEAFDLSFELPPGELAEESGPVLLTFEKIDGKYQLVPKQNKETLRLFASLPFKIDFNVQEGTSITNRVTLTPTIGGAIVDYMPEDLKISILQANQGSSTNSTVARASSDVGGIDFDPTLLKLQIKRNGKGVPLPVEQQNVEQINIEGLFPVILFDRPATIQNFPFLISSGNKEKSPELSMR